MAVTYNVLVTMMALLVLWPTAEQSEARTRRASIPGAALLTDNILVPVEPAQLPTALQGNPNPECVTLTTTLNFECPEGWSKYKDDEGVVCLMAERKPVDRDAAAAVCQSHGGDLVSILTEARQKTVENASKTVEEAWIGLTRAAYGTGSFQWPGRVDMSYDNSENFYYAPRRRYHCVYLTSDSRKWSATRDCSFEKKAYICDKLPENCNPGLFGKYCEKECHCHGNACDKEGNCDYGCQPGWMGPHCCAKKEPADVAHYCMNSEEEGRYLLLRVDPKNVAYDILTPVDVARQPLLWCGSMEMNRDSDGSYTFKVAVTESEKASSGDLACAGQQTGNNSYSWRISLQEKERLRLPMDRTFLLTCDFDNAETLSRGEKYTHTEAKEDSKDHLPPLESPKETREDVVLEVVDPYSQDVIKQAKLGTNVVLRMRVAVLPDGVTAQGVSPFDCQASTLDGKLTTPLTDHHGCPIGNTPVSKLAGSNGTVSSEPFQLFAFPGHQHVSISCAFQFCFGSSQQSLCDDRCGQGNAERRKRDAEEKPEIVTTKIEILSDGDSKPDNSKDATESRSAAARMMTPVTWFLVVALLVVSGVLVYALFFRTVRQPVRRIR